MSADLRDAPFVQLAELHRSRKSGRLIVARGRRGLVIDLRRGEIAGVESQSVPATDAPGLEGPRADRDASGAEPGLVRAAARERVLDALTWTDAFCGFTEGRTESGDPPLELPTEEVLREAAELVTDPDLVRAALGDLDRSLRLTIDPRQPSHLSLTPTEGYLLSRIDGALTARQVLQLAPLEPMEGERSLFGLLLSGIVEHVAVPGRPSEPAAEPAAPLERNRRPERASPPPPAAPAPDAIEAARREIEEACTAKIGNRNHFEVLELDRSADAAAVKAAYFRLAKRFHPDTRLEPALDDLRDMLRAAFVRLGEAYDVLSNPRKRGDYEATLPRKSFSPPRARPVTTPASAPAAPPVPPAPDAYDPEAASPEEEIARRADDLLARAEALVAEERYWDAIQALEGGLGTLAGRRLQKGRLQLARAYAKNPKWLRRAEETAQRVVTEDPGNPDAYLVLGAVYRAGGLESRASAMYKRALELRPDSREAREALGEPETPPSSPGQLLKRLFRKT